VRFVAAPGEIDYADRQGLPARHRRLQPVRGTEFAMPALVAGEWVGFAGEGGDGGDGGGNCRRIHLVVGCPGTARPAPPLNDR
jgi:hypothetical protein